MNRKMTFLIQMVAFSLCATLLWASGRQGLTSGTSELDYLLTEAQTYDTVRSEAALRALALRGRDANRSLPVLLEMYKGKDPMGLLSSRARSIVLSWGVDGAAIAPDLARYYVQYRSPTGYASLSVGGTLADMGSFARDAAPILAGYVLREVQKGAPSREERENLSTTLDILSEIGPAGWEAGTVLVMSLNSTHDTEIAAWVCRALGHIAYDYPEAVEAIKRAYLHGSLRGRRDIAIWALGNLGRRGYEVIDQLLDSDDPTTALITAVCVLDNYNTKGHWPRMFDAEIARKAFLTVANRLDCDHLWVLGQLREVRYLWKGLDLPVAALSPYECKEVIGKLVVYTRCESFEDFHPMVSMLLMFRARNETAAMSALMKWTYTEKRPEVREALLEDCRQVLFRAGMVPPELRKVYQFYAESNDQELAEIAKALLSFSP